MAFDPDAYLQKKSQSSFDPDAYLKSKVEAPEVSGLESGLRGFTQGASLDFQDELAGGMSALGRVAGIKGLGGKLSEIGLAEGGPTLDFNKIGDEYTRSRDAERLANRQAEESNPNTYLGTNIAGGVASTLVAPGLAPAKGAGLLANVGKGALQGGLTATGLSEADNVTDLAADAGMGLGIGGLAGGAGYGLGKGIEKGVEKVSPAIEYIKNKIGGKLKTAAEGFAENATGATAAQSEKFANDAGRQLLDRGIVKPFSTPEGIAQRAGQQMTAANSQIDEALKALDAKGATASVDDIVSSLEQKIKDVSSDPSQAPLARKLQSIVEDIKSSTPKGSPTNKLSAKDLAEQEWRQAIGSAEALPEQTTIPLSEAEKIKRGFGDKISNWIDPESGAANKNAYLGYRDEVEKQALDLDPSLASKFKEGKQTFGLLAPIKEAAERRTAQLNQSPIGGLLDTGSTIATGGNPVGAIARRMISPRISSTAAVGLDKIGDMVMTTPQAFGKYAKVLQDAAQRGPQGVASTHFLLQQTEPGYRQILDQIANQDQPQGGNNEFPR